MMYRAAAAARRATNLPNTSKSKRAIPHTAISFQISVRLGTSGAGKIETCIRKVGLITYENINHNNSGISSAV
jgi:hypothetical protein